MIYLLKSIACKLTAKEAAKTKMLEGIKQWAFTLVITAVVGGLANSFTVSENGGMKKYVKFACAVIALAVMIMPIKEMFKEMPKLFDFYNSDTSTTESVDSESNMYDINGLAEAKINELLKIRISDIVYEKTGIKPDDVYIYIGQKDYSETESEIDVEKIVVNMPKNSDISKIEEMKLYLKQLFNCEVEVQINDGQN